MNHILHLFTVTWKLIVLRFGNEVNEKTLILNNLIAFIAYAIFKYKMKCRFDDETMTKKIILYVLRWYGTPPYCHVYRIEMNNKIQYNFINLFYPENVT